jgi:hypothetical protein
MKQRKIGVTGHTSGIGKEIFDYLQFQGYNNVKGYSRSNGFNMADRQGDAIISDILTNDLDVVFNNAWYPRVQCKIMKVLHEQWKDRENKYIINTGSGSIYQEGLTGNVYRLDKEELAEYAIAASFDWPIVNKCRCMTVSLGWTNTPMVGEHEGFITGYEAALIITNLMHEQNYIIPNIVVGNKQLPTDEINAVRDAAQEYVVEDITKTNRLLNADR